MAASTSRRMSGLTRGDPLTTRETVARDTPAREATSSRVVPFRPRAGAFATEPIPPCESALTCDSHCSSPLSRERSHASHGARGRVANAVAAVVPRRATGPARGPARPPAGRDLCDTFAHGRDRGTPAAAPERYEAVIGIEVHCQLQTASKMFCGCSTAYDGAPPNTPRLPRLLRPAGRLAGHQPAGGGARPGHRPRDRGDRARGDPLGPQELLLPGPAEGLPDQPVRPAARLARPPDLRDVRGTVHGHDHPRASRGGHGQADPPGPRRRQARAASSTSTAPARRSWRSSPSPRSGRPSRPAATPRSCSCCCGRSAPRTRTWSTARCASRRTSRCGRAGPSRSGRGSRSRT